MMTLRLRTSVLTLRLRTSVLTLRLRTSVLTLRTPMVVCSCSGPLGCLKSGWAVGPVFIWSHLGRRLKGRTSGGAAAVRCRSRPDRAGPDHRHPAAQGLGVREDVRAEEHRAATVAQPQQQLAHVAAAERIEARHRSVE